MHNNNNNLIVMLINCWYVSQRALIGIFVFIKLPCILYKIVSKKLDFFHIYFMNIAINVNYLYV